MKISVVGGGPGGLYFSILVKKAWPECQIQVFERNKADDAFGFGVVFSDETLKEFLSRDPGSYELIRSHFAYWDELDVVRDGERVRISGNGFCGCSRKTLLQLLQQRCREEGVILNYEHPIQSLSEVEPADMVVLCDGIASYFRGQMEAEFGTRVEMRKNRFVWLGSTKPLDAFAYFFRSSPWGNFVAHSYQYEEGRSTWVIETTEETWQKAGFEVENEADTLAKIQQIFEAELEGHSLISNKSHWRRFPLVTNERWFHEKYVLLGDAKASAHFSIGSGTKLAMDGAIGLADAVLENKGNMAGIFQAYETKRRGPLTNLQQAANVSMEWFEDMDRHLKLPFLPFSFSLMIRSRRLGFDNLALRDPNYTWQIQADFQQRNGGSATQPALMAPFSVEGLSLPNRVVMSGMGQYQADDGLPNDWHLMHYGARAMGGTGLLISEMTAVSPEGRISLGCPGIWNEAQTQAWKRILDLIHSKSSSKMALQLGHSGRKGATKKPWEGKGQALDKIWPLVSASAIAWSEAHPVPAELDEAGMDRICSQFEQAARNAATAGFDGIEVQAHHGFLLASFLSPLTNRRTDAFGGPVENRLKFPLRIFKAVKAAFGGPVWVRLSAHDWAEGGLSESDFLHIAQAFVQAGAPLINVSTAGTVSHQKPAIGKLWQTPFAEWLRNSLNVPVITTGMIETADQVNSLLLAGKADLVALGRPLLLDPSWTLRAMAEAGVPPEQTSIPQSYREAAPSWFAHQSQSKKAQDKMKKALRPPSHKKA